MSAHEADQDTPNTHSDTTSPDESRTEGLVGSAGPLSANDTLTFGAIVAGTVLASGGSTADATATAIGAAGSTDWAARDLEYQKRWAQRIREAHGWRKVWRIIWG